MADGSPSPHIVVVSSPGIGHLIPLAEFAKLLVLHHNFTATIVTFSDFPFSFLSSLPSSISTVLIPLAPIHDLPVDAHFVTRISLTMSRSVSLLRDTLISLRRTARLAAVVFDLFGSDFLSMAKELGIPRYLFITSNIFLLSFALHLPTLYETTAGEFRNLPEPLRLPGCVPLRGDDFVEPIQERESEVCAWVVHHARHHDLVEGIMVNSFEALETAAAKSLRQRGGGKPPVWPIGPITWSGSESGEEDPSNRCIEWLNRQPGCSVVFLCFGSGGTLSWEQTRELAHGLEMSGQTFLWVVRAPCDNDPSGAYFNPESTDDDPLGFLPEGFAERTKEKGMLVPSWAPQRKVLGHRSTGGFVSHCGWNSTLESMVNGVPMIVWPLYAEQRLNAVLLVEQAGVALRPEVGESGVVRREEVAKVLKELMEGEIGKAVRGRMQETRKEAVRAVGKDGSSSRALEEVVGVFKDLVVD